MTEVISKGKERTVLHVSNEHSFEPIRMDKDTPYPIPDLGQRLFVVEREFDNPKRYQYRKYHIDEHEGDIIIDTNGDILVGSAEIREEAVGDEVDGKVEAVVQVTGLSQKIPRIKGVAGTFYESRNDGISEARRRWNDFKAGVHAIAEAFGFLRCIFCCFL